MPGINELLSDLTLLGAGLTGNPATAQNVINITEQGRVRRKETEENAATKRAVGRILAKGKNITGEDMQQIVTEEDAKINSVMKTMVNFVQFRKIGQELKQGELGIAKSQFGGPRTVSRRVEPEGGLGAGGILKAVASNQMQFDKLMGVEGAVQGAFTPDVEKYSGPKVVYNSEGDSQPISSQAQLDRLTAIDPISKVADWGVINRKKAGAYTGPKVVYKVNDKGETITRPITGWEQLSKSEEEQGFSRDKVTPSKETPEEKRIEEMREEIAAMVKGSESARMGVGLFVPDKNRIAVADARMDKAKNMMVKYLTAGGTLERLNLSPDALVELIGLEDIAPFLYETPEEVFADVTSGKLTMGRAEQLIKQLFPDRFQ